MASINSSTGTISSSMGMGSGLDINGIVKQLVNAEGSPATSALDKRESATNTRLSALGTLRGALSAFQSAAAKLKSTSSFESLSATSSDTSAVTATASSGTGTASGEYEIDVQQLAKAHKLISKAGTADADGTVGQGWLNIKSGSQHFTVIVDHSDTLEDIKNSINDDPENSSVRASVISTDAGEQLVLSALESGTESAITISGVDAGDGNNQDFSGLSRLFYDPANTMGNASAVVNMVEQTAAQDSIVFVDGQEVSSSGNTVTDAIPGVTLKLNSENSSPVSVNVALDEEAVTKTVNDFVAAYNNLQTVMGKLGSYDSSSKTAGDLLGDSTLRSVASQLRRDLGVPVSSASSNYSTLHSMGIEIDRYGVMSVNSTKLSKVINTDVGILKEVFASDDGVATRVVSRVDSYLSSTGALTRQTSSLNKTLRTISDQRLQLQDRLDRVQASLLKQFQAMDTMVGQLNSTGSYLSQQLKNLTISSK